jgi:hypothetical protein
MKLNNLTDNVNKISAYTKYFMPMIVKAMTVGTAYNQLLYLQLEQSKMFVVAAHHLIDHKLHAYLINPKHVSDTINQIGNHLEQTENLYQIAPYGYNFKHYATQKTVSYFHHGKSIFVMIHIPLAFKSFSNFHLYHVSQYPVPISSRSNNNTHIWLSKLTLEDDYLAVSEDNQHHFVSDSSTIATECHGHDTLTCTVYHTIHSITNQNCLSAAYTHSMPDIHTFCRPQIILSAIPPTVITHISSNNFLLIGYQSGNNVTESCASGSTLHPFCFLCHLHVQCGCQMHIQDITVSPDYICESNNETKTVTYFQNAIWKFTLDSLLGDLDSMKNFQSVYVRNATEHLPNLLVMADSTNKSYQSIGDTFTLSEVRSALENQVELLEMHRDVPLGPMSPFLPVDTYTTTHNSYSFIFIIYTAAFIAATVGLTIAVYVLCNRYK